MQVNPQCVWLGGGKKHRRAPHGLALIVDEQG
jgi:hypothetical protein